MVHNLLPMMHNFSENRDSPLLHEWNIKMERGVVAEGRKEQEMTQKNCDS